MSTPANISDEERVLTILHLLDDEVAELALRELEEDVSQRLRTRLAQFQQNPLSLRKQKRVFDDFERFFQFTRKFAKPSPSGLRLHHEDDDIEEYEMTGNPIDDLENMNVMQVTSALEQEFPRTAAILLKELSSERVAGILSLMQNDVRDQVVQHLSADPAAPRVLVQQMARTTADLAATLPAERPEQPNPIERIAKVLREMEKPKRREMLMTLRDQDAETSAKIQKQLFRFDDLATLEDRQLRQVLGKVDTSTLSIALFDTKPEIMDRIQNNLSKRAWITLEEELSFLTHVSETQLKQAQEVVIDAIAEVEMEEG